MWLWILFSETHPRANRRLRRCLVSTGERCRKARTCTATQSTQRITGTRNTSKTMKPRRPLRRMSTKRSGQMREYRKLKAKFFATHSKCVVCNLSVPEQFKSLHHYFGRVGELLTYVPGFRLTHSWCHDTIETHRNEAVRQGLRAPENLFGRRSLVIPKST